MLAAGFHDVPPGHAAAVVTHLEMRAPAPLRPVEMPEGLSLRRVPAPDPDWYRSLFRRIGTDWLWHTRLIMPRETLGALLGDPAVHVHALEREKQAEGLLELDFRDGKTCQISFFGLSPALTGTTAGRFLMNRAITLAWEHPIERLHLHTCTFDSPRALPFYLRSGFVPVRRQVEIVADPRLAGVLPEDAGAHVPILPH